MGNELTVTLSNHDIKLGSDNPSSTEKVWEDDLYVEGNVYLDGYANPVKPDVPVTEYDIEDDDLDLISTDRYKHNLISDLRDALIEEGTEGSGLTVFHAIVVLGTLQMSMTAVLLWFVI